MTVGDIRPLSGDYADGGDPTSPRVVDTTTDAGWASIRREYTGGSPVESLEQIIRLARSHGVQSVLIEPRYVDPDWRSIHARFYGSLFQRYSPTCHRLHLFSAVVKTGDDFSRYQDAYKGFTILRSIPSHPVGRTMVLPPPGLGRATFCWAPQVVHPLGYPLEVRAMPFMSQDGEYFRCSHAVQWMVLHHAHLLRNFPRRLPEEIHLRSQGGLLLTRQVPSGGLSLPQMLSSLNAMGLSPEKVQLPGGGRDRSRSSTLISLPATLCRYVNSQMPPIVISERHAWVVTGYCSRGGGDSHDTTSLYVHDDLAGPYVEVATRGRRSAPASWRRRLTPGIQTATMWSVLRWLGGSATMASGCWPSPLCPIESTSRLTGQNLSEG